MKKVIFLFLLFKLCAAAAIAQIRISAPLSNEIASGLPLLPAGYTLPEGGPGAYGAGIEDLLSQAFDSVCNLSPIKGISAAVMLPDGAIWSRAYGTAGLGLPLTGEHLLGMGSITKSFIAVTLLTLYQDGLLDLDDSIGTYVGPYQNIDGSATIRQVLGHRSGYNDYLNENPDIVQEWLNNIDSLWVVDTVLNHYVLAPNFAPNTDFSYSNTNYLIGGRVIESITGQPWFEVVRNRVLTPLGLTQTFAYPYEGGGNEDLAHVFVDLDGNGSVEDFQAFGLPLEGLFSLASSAGCMITTPKDLVRFTERVQGGHFLQDSTFLQMHTDLDGDPDNLAAYGLGAASFALPLANWGHNGSLLYNSIALYFPELDVAIAVQQNDERTASEQDPFVDFIGVFIRLVEICINNPLSNTTETEYAGGFNVYPNPAQNILQIAIQDAALDRHFPTTMTLFDVSGKIVLQQDWAPDRNQISIGHLPGGLYSLKIGQFVQKIVKY